MAELWNIVERKRSLREKYMPNFTGQLSPESEKRRRKFKGQEETHNSGDRAST
jgi:hypothetical protein